MKSPIALRRSRSSDGIWMTLIAAPYRLVTKSFTIVPAQDEMPKPALSGREERLDVVGDLCRRRERDVPSRVEQLERPRRQALREPPRGLERHQRVARQVDHERRRRDLPHE